MSDTENTPGDTGHLTELDANRILSGELGEGTPEHEHLQGCEMCEAYVARLREEDRRISAMLPPSFAALDANPSSPRTPRAKPAAPGLWSKHRRVIGAALAATLAMGFVALFALGEHAPRQNTGKTVDHIRFKSSHDLVVYVHDGEHARIAHAGEEVHPGDRVGFKIVPSPAGHVMILGIDQTGESYLGFPQDTNGSSRLFVHEEQGVELDQALELDDVLGRERFIMLICDEPFTFEDVSTRLHEITGAPTLDALPALRPGCTQREISLNKRR